MDRRWWKARNGHQFRRYAHIGGWAGRMWRRYPPDKQPGQVGLLGTHAAVTTRGGAVFDGRVVAVTAASLRLCCPDRLGDQVIAWERMTRLRWHFGHPRP